MQLLFILLPISRGPPHPLKSQSRFCCGGAYLLDTLLSVRREIYVYSL